jgi:hypothetical protein
LLDPQADGCSSKRVQNVEYRTGGKERKERRLGEIREEDVGFS